MQVAILLYDGFTALDAVGPYEVLSRVPGARVRFVAVDPGPVVADSGMLTLLAQEELDDVCRPDVIVVPGGAAGTFSVLKDERVLEWIRVAHETTRWTTSVCSGALILGAAGLLDGKQASTHWLVSDRLSEYGSVYAGKRIAEDGRIITAAGVSAGVDMALHLAGRLAGQDVAMAIQLVIEYDPEPPFDCGSLSKASEPIRHRAERMLKRQYMSEVGRRFMRRVLRPGRK